MLAVMNFEVTFKDGSSKKYTDSVKYKIGDNGTLTITDGDDVLIFAPHVWSRIKTQTRGPQVW